MTAAEAVHQVSVASGRIEAGISFRRLDYPGDSVRALLAASAVPWASDFKTRPPVGNQIDPANVVHVTAGNEAEARRQIAKRLDTPGLSRNDRAFTYLMAVHAFTDVRYPERQPTAEAYLAALDRLGDSASSWQFQARVRLAQTAYLAGNRAAVARFGTEALLLANRIPFHARHFTIFPDVGDPVYSITIEALAGQPDGVVQIRRIHEVLRSATVPSPAVVALDSSFVSVGRGYAHKLRKLIEINALVGTQGKPLVAHVWLNRREQSSDTVFLNDGKVRLVEVASTNCGPCLRALAGIEQIRTRLPNVEGVFVTVTTGSWGNRLVEPDDEVRRLATEFQKSNINIPIGIYRAEKTLNEDGGITPVDAGPNFRNYPGPVKPTLWAIDGRGVIRRIFLGYSRDMEKEIIRTLEFLSRETGTAAASHWSHRFDTQTHVFFHTPAFSVGYFRNGGCCHVERRARIGATATHGRTVATRAGVVRTDRVRSSRRGWFIDVAW
jgi:thiol-disulfide isomerase/thioredoxin